MDVTVRDSCPLALRHSSDSTFLKSIKVSSPMRGRHAMVTKTADKIVATFGKPRIGALGLIPRTPT